MKIAVFGLTISSSWGNGHATLWRGLVRALSECGCHVIFFERDMPYYKANRDLSELPGAELVFYDHWDSVSAAARRELRSCDAGIVTSYCPDAVEAAQLVAGECRGVSVFYDLDTPVTLSLLTTGQHVPYIGPRGLRDFDIVLSFTGGLALDQLQQYLGAKRVAPLYGHVDPAVHRRTDPRPQYLCDLSYLGTYAEDRQRVLQALLVDPARLRPASRFLIGGTLYPREFPWHSNIYFVRHLPPGEHAAFFSSSRLTLNVTRESMRKSGWCPSGRLFEAAACGTPLISDEWEGLEAFYAEGREIMIARSTNDVIGALERTDLELAMLAEAALERTLAEHTSAHRAAELLRLLEDMPHATQHKWIEAGA